MLSDHQEIHSTLSNIRSLLDQIKHLRETSFSGLVNTLEYTRTNCDQKIVTAGQNSIGVVIVPDKEEWHSQAFCQTHWIFPNEATFGKHWHRGAECIYVIKGKALWDEGNRSAGPGEWILIPPRAEHTICVEKDTEMLVTFDPYTWIFSKSKSTSDLL